jgi:hypothetical protein
MFGKPWDARPLMGLGGSGNYAPFWNPWRVPVVDAKCRRVDADGNVIEGHDPAVAVAATRAGSVFICENGTVPTFYCDGNEMPSKLTSGTSRVTGRTVDNIPGYAPDGACRRDTFVNGVIALSLLGVAGVGAGVYFLFFRK